MPQARAENVEYSNRLKFGSTIAYTIDDHGIKDVESDNYFHSLSHRYIAPGDEITVSVITKGTLKNPIAWAKARFEVVSCGGKETRVQQITDWDHVDSSPAEEDAAPKKTLTLGDKDKKAA